MSTTISDLTAKARIRNAALELFAEQGAAGTPLRQIAECAGVTVGLITHHFGSKEGLGIAVDDYVVERYREALDAVPSSLPPRQVAAHRDASVTAMLRESPPIQRYLRRAYLEPADADGGVLERLTDLAADEVRALRASGIASTQRSIEEQVAIIVVRQFGNMLLQPLADRVWTRVGGDAEPPQVTTRLTTSS